MAHEKAQTSVAWELGAAQQALGGAQAQVTAAREAAAQVETLRAAIEPLTEDLADWTLLAKAFGITGIPAPLVDQALPEIGQLATDLLRECFGTALFTVSLTTQKRSADDTKLLETLDVVIEREGETLPAEVLSGGEGVLVSEALALAIALYNPSRSGHHARTLFRDEVGANLDTEAGRSQASRCFPGSRGADPVTAMRVHHEDVDHVGEGGAVGHHAREANLATAIVDGPCRPSGASCVAGTVFSFIRQARRRRQRT